MATQRESGLARSSEACPWRCSGCKAGRASPAASRGPQNPSDRASDMRDLQGGAGGPDRSQWTAVRPSDPPLPPYHPDKPDSGRRIPSTGRGVPSPFLSRARAFSRAHTASLTAQPGLAQRTGTWRRRYAARPTGASDWSCVPDRSSSGQHPHARSKDARMCHAPGRPTPCILYNPLHRSTRL